MTIRYSNEINSIKDTHTATGLETVFTSVYHSYALVEMPTITSDSLSEGDNIYLIDIPSNAKILLINMENESFKSVGTESLGLYAAINFTDGDTSYLEDSVINQYAFRRDISMLNNAPTTGQALLNIRFAIYKENVDNSLESYNSEIWRIAGLSKDPKVPIRLGFQIKSSTSYESADFIFSVFFAM